MCNCLASLVREMRVLFLREQNDGGGVTGVHRLHGDRGVAADIRGYIIVDVDKGVDAVERNSHDVFFADVVVVMIVMWMLRSRAVVLSFVAVVVVKKTGKAECMSGVLYGGSDQMDFK